MGKQPRVIIQNIEPQVDNGLFPAKRVVGDRVVVSADIFADGYQVIAAQVLWKPEEAKEWQRAPMLPIGNDRWQGELSYDRIGRVHFTVEGWIDPYASWLADMEKKVAAGTASEVDLAIGQSLRPDVKVPKGISVAEALQLFKKSEHKEKTPEVVSRYPELFEIEFSRKRAGFSSWYEFFPRSASPTGRHGTFADCQAWLPHIVRLGFDVLYLPPVHPIGSTNRKGKNNAVRSEKGDPGSPWAIGAAEGGHDAVHPELGTLMDFADLVAAARGQGLEVAMDLALQCSPDHPYVRKHPEWFLWRPDGSVQYAENPPKKYEDIIPFDFECADWQELWQEIKRVVLHWVSLGVRIFRVDNPHTKPFAFWQWLIGEIKAVDKEVIFLAEAFTRPRVMEYLAKIGFDQSYTYFTWRQTKQELTDYLLELTRGPMKEYYRPNFWPNTPDILPEHLQYGGRAAFVSRLVLAATLSSNYGIYGPPFERCISTAVEGKEEYRDSEKYEIGVWQEEGLIDGVIALVNAIRRENGAFQRMDNLEFLHCTSDQILCYRKAPDFIVAVNLDFHHTQQATMHVPLERFGIKPGDSYLVHDLLSGDRYVWQGSENYIELNPHRCPAHIFKVHPQVKREKDFDYYV